MLSLVAAAAAALLPRAAASEALENATSNQTEVIASVNSWNDAGLQLQRALAAADSQLLPLAVAATLFVFLPWRVSCKLCSLCLSFMWSTLFATLFPLIQQPTSSSGLLLLLLAAATPAGLLICGVLLEQLSFAPSARRDSRFPPGPKWSHILVVLILCRSVFMFIFGDGASADPDAAGSHLFSSLSVEAFTVAAVSCSSSAPPLPLLLPPLAVMFWRLVAAYSSSAVSMWHLIFAIASCYVALQRQRWGKGSSGRYSASHGAAGAGFGVKVTKKIDDSLFEASGLDASVAEESLSQRSFIDQTAVEEFDDNGNAIYGSFEATTDGGFRRRKLQHEAAG